MPNGIFIFVAYIVLEIFVLVQAASTFGGWNVFLMLVAGFVAGGILLQHNRNKIVSGQPPKVTAIIFSSIAGVLLMIPGFVSDIVAICLLLPPMQAYLGKASDRFFMRQGFHRLFRFGNMNTQNPAGFDPKEPEFREDIKVTVVDRDGEYSTEHASRRKKIDDSKIIDVEIDKKD